MYIVNITSTNLGALASSSTNRVLNEVWMGGGVPTVCVEFAKKCPCLKLYSYLVFAMLYVDLKRMSSVTICLMLRLSY